MLVGIHVMIPKKHFWLHNLSRNFYIGEKYSQELNKVILYGVDCFNFKGGSPYIDLFSTLILLGQRTVQIQKPYSGYPMALFFTKIEIGSKSNEKKIKRIWSQRCYISDCLCNIFTFSTDRHTNMRR